MKKVNVVIIVIFFISSFTGITFSAEKERKMFAGAVKEINTKERTITLRNDKQGEFTGIIDDKAVIRMTNGKKSMSDISIGDIAAVVYEEVNGKNIAESIMVITPVASSSGGQSNPATSEGKK